MKKPEHSLLFSPSDLYRRLLCPGSADLEAQVKLANQEAEGGEVYRNEGSVMHAIAYDLLIGKRKTFRGLLNKERDGVLITSELADCTKQFVKDAEEFKPGVCETSFEVKKDLAFLGEPDIYGTSDVVYAKLFEMLKVLDFKGGAGVYVSPYRNPQIMAYALCAAGKEIDFYPTIVLGISQPRHYSTKHQSLRTWNTTAAELLDWYKGELKPVIDKIRAGTKEWNPGEEQCQFCKAKDICPAYTETSLSRIGEVANGVGKAPVVNAETVRKVYPHRALIRSWLKRIEKKAFAMVVAGEYPEYKMVTGKNSREWIDEPAAVSAITSAGGDAFITNIVSPAAAEKQGKKVREAIENHITSKPGNPTIAKIDDKRPALDAKDELGLRLPPIKQEEKN